MLCSKPFIQAGHAFGCGQCMPCRVKRRRVWTHRILLETAERKDNAFITLTYAEDKLPEGGTLVPRDLQLFFKRLRKAYPKKLRYYAVGEYGDRTERPHYHIALFGYPRCERGNTSLDRHGKCCQWCDLIGAQWQQGRIFIGELNEQTAAYVAQYVTKKLTSKSDPLLRGRHPEFARMSNRPGIGGDFVDEIASTIMEHDLEKEMEDVPISLRHGARELPLGPYLRRRLRTRLGRSEKTPQSILEARKEELRPLFDATWLAEKGTRKQEVTRYLLKESNGRRIQLERRGRLYSKKKDII